ncbi:hypothetical protein K0M31_011266 [Melipona bicolor]|uniref:Uncharacterized protein n=1 Tax=Melipona bicolor TaxID=60889 RepID=A0AA40KUV1_9HYME|nr:hypothetical protein K0M31_011266 [Melipona bicolor]
MTTATTTLAASSTKLDVEAEDDEEPPTTFEALDMDLVNGPNPWLPAYGFQLQHRSHFQPVHEDLRTNDAAIASRKKSGRFAWISQFPFCVSLALIRSNGS